ncbi:MAG: SLC13 family permease [Phycisphaeraceae bacterium]|nr:SLC13 family permease [Phycisphaeraceae bacterium]
MNLTIAAISVILVLTLAAFIWGKWKPEIVALGSLVLCAILGIVPAESAFVGFGHPAVITVAAVLVISRALTASGLVDRLTRPLERTSHRPVLLLTGLMLTVAVLSAFINNVGALAVLMPVTLRLARNSGKPVSMFLMPLAFGSLLGGMTTLIGTPPNLIVSGFRAVAARENGLTPVPFAFFDFLPVGGLVAVAGIVFMLTIGWRLVPVRSSRISSDDLIKVGKYLTEATVVESSAAAGKSLRDISPKGLQVLSIIRGERRITAPSPHRTILSHDVLVMMGESAAIEKFVKEQKLELLKPEDELSAELLESEEIALAEGVVMPDARIVGASAKSLRLRERHGINLLGIAREGERLDARLADARFRPGDVLLVQGARESLSSDLADFGCLPLAERDIGLGKADTSLRALAIFVVAIIATVMGWLSAPVAFTGAAMLMVVTGVIGVRQAYAAIDWPVLVLLGAMIPVGLAIESAGLAALIAKGALAATSFAPLWAMLAIVLVATMFLSDLVNNAAAAVMMCPIALAVAAGLNASADPFLLAVAIGASCAFLTPIGHQSNLLVMGPGGYRFGDYWRPGLLLEVVIAAVAVAGLMVFWPAK